LLNKNQKINQNAAKIFRFREILKEENFSKTHF